MERSPSILDIARAFLGILFGLGPFYWIPILVCFIYGGVYGLELYRAALNDPRNVSRLRTRHFASVILWERILKYDAFALAYIIFFPAGPILFFIGVFTVMKR